MYNLYINSNSKIDLGAKETLKLIQFPLLQLLHQVFFFLNLVH